MIEITCSLRNGYVYRLSSRGHADGSAPGQNIVCASVTVLLRSFARSVEAAGDLEWEGEAPEPGLLNVLVRQVPDNRTEWMIGLSDFLLRGLSDLEAEYRDEMRLRIETE